MGRPHVLAWAGDRSSYGCLNGLKRKSEAPATSPGGHVDVGAGPRRGTQEQTRCVRPSHGRTGRRAARPVLAGRGDRQGRGLEHAGRRKAVTVGLDTLACRAGPHELFRRSGQAGRAHHTQPRRPGRASNPSGGPLAAPAGHRQDSEKTNEIKGANCRDATFLKTLKGRSGSPGRNFNCFGSESHPAARPVHDAAGAPGKDRLLAGMTVTRASESENRKNMF